MFADQREGLKMGTWARKRQPNRLSPIGGLHIGSDIRLSSFILDPSSFRPANAQE